MNVNQTALFSDVATGEGRSWESGHGSLSSSIPAPRAMPESHAASFVSEEQRLDGY